MKDRKNTEKNIFDAKHSFEKFSPLKLSYTKFYKARHDVDKMVFKGNPQFKICTNFSTIWENVRKTSSSGYPYLKKKGDLLELASNFVRDFNNEKIDMSIFTTPCVTYIVYQPSGSGYKGRLVYCPPLQITLLEIIFGLSFTEYLLDSEDSSLVMGDTQPVLYSLMKKYNSKQSKFTGDYSSYDQTIPSELIATSMFMLKAKLKLSDFQSNVYDKLVSYIMHSHIYHPLCGFTFRKRGIISGSYYTNIVDGLTNLLMISYSSRCLNMDIDDIKVCGDDNLIVHTSPINRKLLSKFLLDAFGVVHKVEKEDIAYPNSNYLGSFLGSK